MDREEILYLVPYLFSLLLSAAIFLYSWTHRRVRGAGAYTWFMGGQTLSNFGFILKLMTSSLETKILWDKFLWIVQGTVIIIAFLAFAIRFSEHRIKRPLTFWIVVSAIPAIFNLLVITDNFHHLIYPNPTLVPSYPFPDLQYDFTIVVYIFALYIYAATFYGISLLLRRAFQPHNSYRAQYLVVATGFSIPIAFSILALFNIRITPQRDATPFTFAIGNLIVAWGLFRHRVFDLVPIARDTIFDNINDLIAVLDIRDRVVDMNPAGLAALGWSASQVIGKRGEVVFAKWPGLVERFLEVKDERTEITTEVDDHVRHYELNISSLRNHRREMIGRLFVVRDITAHKMMDNALQRLNADLELNVQERTKALRESEERFAILSTATFEAIGISEGEKIIDVNDQMVQMFGYSREEFFTMSAEKLVAPESIELVRKNRGSGIENAYEHIALKKDGTRFPVEVRPRTIPYKGRNVRVTAIRDITERKQAEETILKQLAFDEVMTRLLTSFATCSYAEIDTSIENALREVAGFFGGESADILLLSEDKKSWNLTHFWMNPQLAVRIRPIQTIHSKTLTWSEGTLLGGEPIKINSLDDYPSEATPDRKLGEAEGIKSLLSVPIKGKEQSVFGVIDLASYNYQAAWTDIDVAHLKLIGDAIANLLERKRVEDALRQSEERFSKAFKASPVIITIFRVEDGKFLDVNEAFIKASGYDREEVIGSTGKELGLWASQVDRDRIISKLLAEGKLRNEELQFQIRNGTVRICYCSAELIELGGERCILATIEDVTEQKKAEERILRLNRLYATISQINQTIVHTRDLSDLLREICRVATENGQFRMAWVGLIDEGGEVIKPAIFAGEELGYLENLNINYHDKILGSGPTSTAIREGHCVICQDIASDPRMEPWREQALSRGYHSSAAVPFREHGNVIGVLTVYASEPRGFDAEDEQLLEEIGLDISFAIDSIDDESKRKQAEENLLETYDTTLEGWAKALELRDKETEGHSRRVTELTIKLAREVGVNEEDLIQIYRGAILHDIGKMAVPDEILRKAGRLNEKEWVIVRRHPVIAYELLSPIAYLKKAIEIPYCHHEHWDGSGYPRKLKGEEIPLAARIFAVADVWDAVQSDRPYNKGWSREKTIEYLKAQSGYHFDPKIVEIFLKLIEQGKI